MNFLQHAFHYEELKSEVLKHVLVFEKLMVNVSLSCDLTIPLVYIWCVPPQDVKKTAANDDNYFVFEDIMHQVLLCFLHDSSLIQHFQHLSPTPFKACYKGTTSLPHLFSLTGPCKWLREAGSA